MTKKKYRKFRKDNRCRFCRSGVAEFDYKDIITIQKLCTPQAKLYSARRSGNCAKHQRRVKVAIKHARFMALVPFTC